jgi:hypothetical protein
MAIVTYQAVFPGQNDAVMPRFIHLLSTDTLAVVAGAGYLDVYLKANSKAIYAADWVFASASDGHQIYKPVINAGTGSVTLTVLP